MPGVGMGPAWSWWPAMSRACSVEMFGECVVYGEAASSFVFFASADRKVEGYGSGASWMGSGVEKPKHRRARVTSGTVRVLAEICAIGAGIRAVTCGHQPLTSRPAGCSRQAPWLAARSGGGGTGCGRVLAMGPG